MQDSKLHTAKKEGKKEDERPWWRGNESEWDGEELKRVDILSATYRSSDIVAPATFFHDSTSATSVVFFCRCIFPFSSLFLSLSQRKTKLTAN